MIFAGGQVNSSSDAIRRKPRRARLPHAALICTSVIAASTASAHAAWVEPRGDLLTISALTAYRADAFFESGGHTRQTERFEKFELSSYLAYGYSDKLTIGAQPTFVRVRTTSSRGTPSRTTLDKIELFGRREIRKGNGWVVSTQFNTKIRSNNSGRIDRRERPNYRDIEVRLLWGHSGQWRRRDYFFSAETGYRYRTGGAADQIRLDATAGFRPTRDWQLLLQNFNINATTQSGDPGTRFNLHKLQFSVLKDISRSTALQLGGFTELAGRNTGAGRAIFGSFWRRF